MVAHKYRGLLYCSRTSMALLASCQALWCNSLSLLSCSRSAQASRPKDRIPSIAPSLAALSRSRSATPWRPETCAKPCCTVSLSKRKSMAPCLYVPFAQHPAPIQHNSPKRCTKPALLHCLALEAQHHGALEIVPSLAALSRFRSAQAWRPETCALTSPSTQHPSSTIVPSVAPSPAALSRSRSATPWRPGNCSKPC